MLYRVGLFGVSVLVGEACHSAAHGSPMRRNGHPVSPRRQLRLGGADHEKAGASY